MARNLNEFIPDRLDIVSLEPEQLARYLLACLNTGNDERIDPVEYAEMQARRYGDSSWVPIARAITEAWQWLARECLVAIDPYYPLSPRKVVYLVTRRGKQLQNPSDFDSFVLASLLPKQILHPIIHKKVIASFTAGDYDTAVFQAFKEVEVAVRKAGQSSDSEIGINLMRKSFHPDNGPLTHKNSLQAERESLMHLFAGAIGSYKNPCSHRHVAIEASEAVEMIILASHLMNIIDSRTPP